MQEPKIAPGNSRSADVTYFGDGFLVAHQAAGVTLYRWTPGFLPTTFHKFLTIPSESGQGAPRLHGYDGSLYVAYRDAGDVGKVFNVTRGELVKDLGPCGSPHPFGWGKDFRLAYRRPPDQTKELDLRSLTTRVMEKRLTSMGLSHMERGKPIYIDDLFHRVAWGTRPAFAGDLTIAEGSEPPPGPPDSGVLARFASIPKKQAWLWKGELSFVPRCAQGESHLDKSAVYAVCAAGPLRVVELTQADATGVVTP